MTSREHRIYSLLQQAAHSVKKAADRTLLKSTGLTTAQAAVLAVLVENSATTQRELSRQLHLNESAMTAMVARLLKLGYVTRTRSADDGRTWLIDLSPSGKKAVADTRGPFSEINSTLDRSIGSSQTAKLARQLRSVIDAFDRD